MNDADCMARALHLAERGRYTTHPNPRVGCVLLRDDCVVGEGFHVRAGGPHAEIVALEQAGNRARGSHAFVTLEPCSHQGRTLPCTDALIEAGVARITAAMGDPNPVVAGRGLERLREAGIEVRCGLMAASARALNRGFISRNTRGRPWVRLKLAMSLDGRTAMASGESQWITASAARNDGHRLRAECGAVMTGINTVLADDPALTVRLPGDWKAPARIVVDSDLRTPVQARVLQAPGRALLFTAVDQPGPINALRAAGADVVPMHRGADGRIILDDVLVELARREIGEVLVESGPTLAGALLRRGLVDQIEVYVAPLLLGSEARGLVSMPGLERLAQGVPLAFSDVRRVGRDLRLTLLPVKSQVTDNETAPDAV